MAFAHANSYGASTYRVLFEQLRARGLQVHALEQLGHDERYPVSDNWPHLVQQLADFARATRQQVNEPVWLVGHSLGGVLSAMAAALHPDLAQGVVLLDAPILSGWRARVLHTMKAVQLVGRMSPGAVSRQRRHRWPTEAAALEHFAAKPVFARWHPQVLRDYVAHGTRAEQGTDAGQERTLAFDRDVETRIYNTFPHDLDALFKRNPLRCPVAYIGGRDSREMRQVGMRATRALTQGRILMIDGSHLFPMENPQATAAALEAALHSMQAHQP